MSQKWLELRISDLILRNSDFRRKSANGIRFLHLYLLTTKNITNLIILEIRIKSLPHWQMFLTSEMIQNMVKYS